MVKVRDVSHSEQLKKYDEFLKMNIKKKLDKSGYEIAFKSCVELKNASTDLFKAKYSFFNRLLDWITF